MATVIDEFIISIGLNAASFNQQQAQAVQSLRKFEQQAVSSASSVERASQKMLDGFSRLTREILGVGAAMLGVNGLKDLAVKTVDAAAGVERLATALDIDPVLANKWVNLMRVVAGQSPGTTINALGQLRRAVEEFLKTGKGPLLEAKPAMEAMGIKPPENIKDIDQWLLRIGAAAQQPQNKEFLSFLLTRIPGMSELGLGLREPNLARELDRLQNLTQEQVKAADQIKRDFMDIIIRLEGLVNRFLVPAERVVSGTKKGIDEVTSGQTVQGVHDIAGALIGNPRQIQADTSKGWGWLLSQGALPYLLGVSTPKPTTSLTPGAEVLDTLNMPSIGHRPLHSHHGSGATNNVTIHVTTNNDNPRAFGRAAADAFYDAVGIQAQNGGH